MYDILLHKDRKKLHREAAVLYEDGACERPGQETSDDFYTYLKELVRHWVCAVQGTKISRRSSVELTRNDALARSDVKLAFNAIRKLLDLVFTHGKGNAEGMDENLVRFNPNCSAVCCQARGGHCVGFPCGS